MYYQTPLEYINLKPFEDCTIEIESEGKIYELHNDADFLEFKYNINERKVYLIWSYPSKWFIDEPDCWNNSNYLNLHDIKDKTQRKISLVFEQVFNVEMSKRDVEMPYEESECLCAIYTKDLENSVLEFDFHGDHNIKIQANSLRFVNNFIDNESSPCFLS